MQTTKTKVWVYVAALLIIGYGCFLTFRVSTFYNENPNPNNLLRTQAEFEVNQILSAKHSLDTLRSEAIDRKGFQSDTMFHHNIVAKSEEAYRALVFRRNTRYWLDRKHKWPKEPIPAYDKYVTYVPWHASFNNVRMSLEMAAAFAYASNRTLVLPPAQNMYLRGKSSMETYFDIDDFKRGFSVITYNEFFDRVNFGEYQSRTNSGSVDQHYVGLKSMPGVYHVKEKWGKLIGSQIVYCFPNCPTAQDEKSEYEWFKKFSQHMTAFSADDQAIVDSKIVHFDANLLGHFYTFIYHRDPIIGSRIKRAVRDHLHYREEIFERAERVIAQLKDFEFSCFHIRRNDNQFKDTMTPADEIVEHTYKLFEPNEIIYVATDEVDQQKNVVNPKDLVEGKPEHRWFEPFRKKFGSENVKFFSDYFHLLKDDTDGPLLGCIETVICSRARMFVGTRKSTFTGYINRMRGYMTDVQQKMILDAQTIYPNDYFSYLQGPEWFHIANAYGGGHPYWGREYTDAWEHVGDPMG